MLLPWLAMCVHAYNILEIGDSNAKGTIADTVWGGDAVQDGWEYINNGTLATVWPSGNNPTPAKGPYLVDLAITDGHTSGWYIRRGTSGAKTTWPGVIEGQWEGALDDVAAAGGVPDLVILDYGANDSKVQSDADAYQDNTETLLSLIFLQWPDTRVVLAKERTTNNGAANVYIYLRTTIYDAISAMDSANSAVFVADGTACDLYDAIHWSTGGHGGGQECVAELVWAFH